MTAYPPPSSSGGADPQKPAVASIFARTVLGLLLLGIALPPSGLAQDVLSQTLPELLQSPQPRPLVSERRSQSAEENLGRLTHRYPIEVPPGTGGHTPGVALVYSNHSRNSPFGWGWTLEPVSTIERSTRFGTPIYGSADRFELDGELLVRHANPTSRYSLLRHDSSRIEYQSTEDRWTVTRPDGTQLRYGYYASQSNSRLRRTPWGGGTAADTFRWMLDEVVDPRGNSYRIEYEPDLYMISSTTYASFLYPRRIRYSFKDGTEPAQQRTRLIEFRWEQGRGTEPDYPTSYRSRFKIQIRWRLQEIVTGITSSDPNTLSASDQLRRYVLTYAPKPTPQDPLQTPFSRLVAIDRFGRNGAPFPTNTTLTYAAPPRGFTAEPDKPTAPWTDDITNLDTPLDPDYYIVQQLTDLLDIDGDALIDRVYANGGTLHAFLGLPGGQWSASTPLSTSISSLLFTRTPVTQANHGDHIRTLIDLDADGRRDHLAGAATTDWSWKRNLGGSFAGSVDWDRPQSVGFPSHSYLYLSGPNVKVSTTSTVTDVNGDSLPDHLRVFASPSGHFEVSPNKFLTDPLGGFSQTATGWDADITLDEGLWRQNLSKTAVRSASSWM